MDTPIISPWFFYWISFVDKIQAIFIAGIVISVIVVIVTGIVWICGIGYDDEGNEVLKKKFLPLIKKAVFWSFVSMFLVTVIPNKTTLIEMAVAKNVTPATIEAGKDAIKSSADYIFEKIKSLTPEETKK